MHPELWTVPGTKFTIPSYGFAVLVGFLLAAVLAIIRAKRVKANTEVITSMVAIGGLAGALGARGMHLVHYYWGRLISGEMDAEEVVATLAGGGEVLGGVGLATVCVIAYLAVTRKSIRLYLDIAMPPMILAMGIGRIGCLMAGCCWGDPCMTETGDKGLPWAVRFPYGSPPYLMQWYQGQLVVPEELMWTPPGTTRQRPLQRELLWDSALLSDETLARCADHMQAIAALANGDPQSPRIAEHRREVQALRDNLPGRTKEEKLEHVAALIHLRELAARGGTTPHAVLAKLRELAAAQQSLWVHPTQLYDAIGLFILFVLLSAIFYRRRRHGLVLAWTMVLYSISRFLQEMIRGDNPRDVAGLTVSQFISLVMLVVGLACLVAIVKYLPERSPRAAVAPPA